MELSRNRKYNQKWSDEEITLQVAKSESWSDLARRLGCNQMNGAINRHLQLRVKKIGCDASHFVGRFNRRGKANPQKRNADAILVNNADATKRVQSRFLRRSLLEMGREYRCSECLRTEHFGKPIFLQIDHIDRSWKNNLPENLRFLCGCCHDIITHNKVQ